jgi:hypothetical protein
MRDDTFPVASATPFVMVSTRASCYWSRRSWYLVRRWRYVPAEVAIAVPGLVEHTAELDQRDCQKPNKHREDARSNQASDIATAR